MELMSNALLGINNNISCRQCPVYMFNRSCLVQWPNFISGPQLWNSLPLDVRQSRDNLMQFKMKLKTFLFQQFWALLWIQSNEGPYTCSILLLILLYPIFDWSLNLINLSLSRLSVFYCWQTCSSVHYIDLIFNMVKTDEQCYRLYINKYHSLYNNSQMLVRRPS